MDRSEPPNRRPVDREQHLDRLAIQGTLPPGLRGTLYRNGPNPRFPADDQHWFGGDGMIHALTLSDAGVSYRNRWVRTARYQQEARAGRSLFRGLGQSREPLDPLPGDAPGGAANTAILHHAGQLLALEEGHAPAALDPRTLDTLSGAPWQLGDGPLTAHPRTDPGTGALWFFGTGADPTLPMLRVGALDCRGRLLLQDRIEAPYRSLVHDFVVTARHVAIPLFPLVLDIERARSGGLALAWEPGRGCFLGLMRRDDPAATLRWLPVDTCHAYHVMNAWEEADCLLLDLMQSDAPPFFTHPSGEPTSPGPATLWRWRVDLSRPGAPIERMRLSDRRGEFPQIDPRAAGLAYRHGFHAAAARADALDAICHYDGQANRESLFVAPDGDALSEPVFVPRTPTAAEGDGWLLALQYRHRIDRSDLVVLDTSDVAGGPVATVPLPCRVPAGFHGAFVEQPA